MSNIDVDATKEQAEKAKLLPEPKGYRILCAVPQVEEEGAVTVGFDELEGLVGDAVGDVLALGAVGDGASPEDGRAAQDRVLAFH